MLATSSSVSCDIGGITESDSTPLTCTWPDRPCRITCGRRLGSAAIQSEPASGGNTPSSPWPLAMWQVEQVPANSASPALAWPSVSSSPASAACAASPTGAVLALAYSAEYTAATSLSEYVPRVPIG